MAAYIDHEHRSNIRLFKWPAKLFIEKPYRSESELVILIRSSSPEIVAVPFSSIYDFIVSKMRDFFRTLMKIYLTNLGIVQDVTYDLLIRESYLKLGFLDKSYLDPNHALVLFIDLSIKHASNEIPLISEKMPQFVTLKADAGMNLEMVEEIEECLKGLMVVEGEGRMKEAEWYCMETGVLLGSEEDEQGCPICLEKICVGDRIATTYCSHRFHRRCISTWMLESGKRTCPMCRKLFEMCEI